MEETSEKILKKEEDVKVSCNKQRTILWSRNTKNKFTEEDGTVVIRNGMSLSLTQKVSTYSCHLQSTRLMERRPLHRRD